MATHHFEAVFTEETVHCAFGEDFVSSRRREVFAARFAARGDGTAASVAAEIAPVNCSWEVWRVVNGVRSETTTRQDAAARARQFGGRRW